MAKIYSPYSNEDPDAPFNEMATMEQLKTGLSDAYTIIHSARWIKRREGERSQHGEVDFVVVGPQGNVVLIEQKNGLLREVDGQLIKQYSSGSVSPVDQISRSYGKLLGIWQKGENAGVLQMESLVYLPDFEVQRSQSTAIELTLIDAKSKGELAQRIALLLEPAHAQCAQASRVIHFFLSVFDYSLDIGALLAGREQRYRWRQQRYSEVLRQMNFQPAWLLIEGVAGAGKTQIAVDLLGAAVMQQRRVGFYCVTRQLAEKIKSEYQGAASVYTLEGWARRQFELSTNNRTKEEKKALEASLGRGENYYGELLARCEPQPGDKFDLLILDEAQDVSPSMFDFIKAFLKPDGALVVCRDLHQQTLPEESFSFTPTVTLSLWESFRCPSSVLAITQYLTGIDCGLRVDEPNLDLLNELDIDLSEVLQAYESENEMIAMIQSLVSGFLEEGFTLDQMIVLSAKKQSDSLFNRVEKIGGWPLKWYSGEYNQQGKQVYRPGELFADTLFRFKGLEKPVVILVEVDSDEWLEHRRRRLYSGCTRTSARLRVLMTSTAQSAWQRWRIQTKTATAGECPAG